MKKIVCVCLVLLFLLGVFSSALGESLDSAFDKAFDKNRLSFKQVRTVRLIAEDRELVLPPAEVLEELGLAGVSTEEAKVMLRTAQLVVISYSPDGTYGVGFISMDGSVFPVAVSPDRIVMIYPTHQRGVEDKYEVLEKYYMRNCFKLNNQALLGMGDEGMIWSSSGRYCCVLNSERTLTTGQAECGSPIFIDTHTGEMFMVDSFNTKFSGDDAGHWLSGCFSEDEQYFYAMYYGRRFENICTFLRYDMATFGYEELCGMAINGRPTLTQLKDGSILALSDTRGIGRTAQQIIKIAPDGTVEAAAIEEMMNATQEHPLYYKRLYCSAESGWALAPASFVNKSVSDSAVIGLLRLRPEDGLSEGMDTLWMICAQTLQPEAFSKEQLSEYYASDFDRYWSDKDYLYIVDVKLSPEGRYAAVIAGAPQGRLHDEIAVMLIIRLSDMKALEAKKIDIGKLNSVIMPRNQYLLNLSDQGILYTHSGLFQVK